MSIFAFSIIYLIAVLVVLWYVAIAPSISNYVGKKLLNTEKKIIIAFCIAVMPLILSAFTGKILASYSMSTIITLLYLHIKQINKEDDGKN